MKYSKGFTLIEIVVVLAIIVALVAVVAPPFMQFRKNQAIQNSANAVTAVLNEARAKTLAAYNNTSYSVQFESGQAVLFTGTTYTSGAAMNVATPYDSSVTLGAVTLNGGSSKISFDRLKGTTSQYGTIVLGISGGPTKTITVSAAGIISRN